MTIYNTPTKLFIDEEAKNIGSIISSYGFKNILFVYGKNSIKKTGLYDEVISSLKESNINYSEVAGVQANPTLSFVRDALNANKEFDFILAVGGGSVIDTAKSIAVSKAMNVDPWEINNYQVTPTSSIPVGIILTISAAGSEMSNSCVITNDETGAKQGFNNECIRPLFAIMNPKYTYGVSKYQTACGIVDIMSHTLERFIDDDKSVVADNIAIAILKSVKEAGAIAYNNPNDYDSRKTLMLSSSLSHNGLTAIGKKHYFRAHQFEHVLSGMYPDLAHGAGLAICFPAYMTWAIKNNIGVDSILRLAYEVFDVKSSNDKTSDALKGIANMEEYFKSLGMPTRLGDLNIGKEKLDEMVERISRGKTRIIPDIVPLDYNAARSIFEVMW